MFLGQETRARFALEISSTEAIRVGLIGGADATFYSYFNNTSTPTRFTNIYSRIESDRVMLRIRAGGKRVFRRIGSARGRIPR